MLNKNNQNTKKKILITGNPFSWNLGSMALVISSIQTLQKINKNITFYKGSVDKAEDIKNYSKYFLSKELVIFGFNKGNLPMPLAVIILLFWSIPYYLKNNLIIENPGEISNDRWLFSQFLRFILAKILFKKFIIYGISAGPFKYSITRMLAKFMYNRCYKIFIRENISKVYLENLGVKNIEIVADHAFLLMTPSQERKSEIDQKYVFDRCPFVGMSVKHLYDEHANYKKSIIGLINYIYNHQEKNIFLIPHSEEDRKLSINIRESIKNKQVYVVTDNLLPDELKYIISKAEIFVGSRIHSCIASWSSCVPTLVFVPKNDHRGIGMSMMLDLEEYIVDPDIKESRKLTQELVGVYEKLYDRKRLIKNKLRNKMPKMEDLAMKGAKFVVDDLFAKK